MQPPHNGCPMCAHLNINTPCVLPSCLETFLSLLFLGCDFGGGRPVCDGDVLSFRGYDNKHFQLLHMSNFFGMLSLMLCFASPHRPARLLGAIWGHRLRGGSSSCSSLDLSPPQSPAQRLRTSIDFRLLWITRASMPEP